MSRFNNYVKREPIEYVIQEAVIFIDMAYISNIFKKNINVLIKYSDNKSFIEKLNKLFNRYQIYFINGISSFKAYTKSNGKVYIECGYDFFDIFKKNTLTFLYRLEVLLKHELVHREQIKKIKDIDKFKGTKDLSTLEYLLNKHEMMYQSQEIIDWLLYNYRGDKGKVIKYLQDPYSDQYKIEVFGKYLEIFKNTKFNKYYKRLYKYMYEYLIGSKI